MYGVFLWGRENSTLILIGWQIYFATVYNMYVYVYMYMYTVTCCNITTCHHVPSVQPCPAAFTRSPSLQTIVSSCFHLLP